MIEFDPATMQAELRAVPPDTLTPCQVLQLVFGLLSSVVQVAAINENALAEASRNAVKIVS